MQGYDDALEHLSRLRMLYLSSLLRVWRFMFNCKSCPMSHSKKYFMQNNLLANTVTQFTVLTLLILVKRAYNIPLNAWVVLTRHLKHIKTRKTAGRQCSFKAKGTNVGIQVPYLSI